MKRKARVNQKQCVACGACIKVCPLKAISIVRGIYSEINGDKCVGCGKCVKECPANVVSFQQNTLQGER